MDPNELILLVKWNPEDLAFQVISERDFLKYMIADTGSFYPQIPRLLREIDGVKFDGYLWFTCNVDALASDQSVTVANYLQSAADNFSNYDFETDETLDEASDMYVFVAAKLLHPDILAGVKIKGYVTECPFASQKVSSPMDLGLNAMKQSPSEEAIEGQRPMWLL